VGGEGALNLQTTLCIYRKTTYNIQMQQSEKYIFTYWIKKLLKIDDVEVSYILSGKENLTLKTILDIQNILNIPLLNKNDIL
jgi:hypothetical protein